MFCSVTVGHIDGWEEEGAISARVAKKVLPISARASKKALFRLEQRRRRYLGASSEEGAISARTAKKALFRRELRRRRYFGANSKKALSQAEFFFSNFVVAALRARMCSAASGKRRLPEYFFKLETIRVSKFVISWLETNNSNFSL